MRVRVIDAFAERPFAGNAAGVLLLDGDAWPDDAWMQSVAAELCLPMTAFARPLADDDGADWGLRWFMPLKEEHFCGHATLATGHALREDGRLGDGVRFRTLAGVLSVRTGADDTITLDFPAATVRETDAPEGLARALGAAPDAVFDTGSLRDRLAVFADAATVRSLAPDMAALAEVTRRGDIRGVTATAPGDDAGYDFVSRFFSPADGLPEDPVTGSAHTALAPYWAARLGREQVTGKQVSRRGGVVACALRGDRVDLTGRAVTVLDGTLSA